MGADYECPREVLRQADAFSGCRPVEQEPYYRHSTRWASVYVHNYFNKDGQNGATVFAMDGRTRILYGHRLKWLRWDDKWTRPGSWCRFPAHILRVYSGFATESLYAPDEDHWRRQVSVEYWHLEGKDYTDKNRALSHLVGCGYTIIEAYEYLRLLWWEGVLRGEQEREDE